MSENNHDNTHYKLFSPRKSLHRTSTADLGQLSYDGGNVPHRENEATESSNEPPRDLQVRFRSHSLQRTPDHSLPGRRVVIDRSKASQPPLLPPCGRSTDLTYAFLSDKETGDAASERNHNPNNQPPPHPYSCSHDVSDNLYREKETPKKSGSAKERWTVASQILRQKAECLMGRLRPVAAEGYTLGPSPLPRNFEERRGLHGGKQGDDEKPPSAPGAEAHHLVCSMTHEHFRHHKPRSAYMRSSKISPECSLRSDSGYESQAHYGGGILLQLLKLHASQAGSSKDSVSPADSSDIELQLSSGASTHKKEDLKWYKKSKHQSTASLVDASMKLSLASLPAMADGTSIAQPKAKEGKEHQKNLRNEILVKVNNAKILARQRCIMQLCQALMQYGAPTHRLEEYMQMAAKVLAVDGQFFYLPGCMIMSFDSPITRTAKVKLVSIMQGVDLGRLADTHNVYKNLVHGLIEVKEAIQELDDIMKRKPRFNKWILVLTYGLASAAVGPFAFDSRPIDMPICFFLGSLVGLMQHVLAPKSVLYSNVFEVTAAVLTSFLSRALGSIRVNWGEGEEYLFCFSALSQSSVVLILPGFLVLCSSLELQSHQIVSGSIRMVYAIIYSLFLGYGTTLGTTMYGLVDVHATSQKTCSRLSVYGNELFQHFPFVPIFAMLLAIINQTKWKQIPVMVIIAVCGYITNYFSTKKLGPSSEVANTVGAFTIGILGNLYSRFWHGHAATAILPGIFVLVPSGLASSGSLIAGLKYADQVRDSLHGSGNSSNIGTSQDLSFASLGLGMIQVAIGITVGLFLAALIVYPFGKQRSGLFSF